MKKSSVKADFVMPILVLTLICLVLSAVLAFTNKVTDPVIIATENAIAEAARAEVLPEADGFTEVDVELPEGSFVTAAYKANNGVGYVFMITCNGYGGKGTMKLTDASFPPRPCPTRRLPVWAPRPLTMISVPSSAARTPLSAA